MSSPANAAPIPPQSLEAEESVLGALMLMPYDSRLIDDIRATGLQPADFYRETHATIYRAALELQGERVDPDAIALTDRLQEQGRLDTIGGRTRIHELAALVPATVNAPHYARIVHEMGMLRGLIRTGSEISRLGWERKDDTPVLLEQARMLLETTTNGSGPASTVQVVTLAQFTAVTDEHVEPLIGTSDETLLPADGMLLMYGDGGAGKTSLSIDALAHVAAGTDWLGQPIPKPARCLLIENEGPRGPFRRRLQQKVRQWAGQPFVDNVHVLEEPWTRFTLTDPGYRRGLAKEIDRTHTQLVIVGPLASLGAKGTGTPDDVNEFSALISDLKAQAETQFAIWIVHHENKAGDVSGAWERVPDTLVHVSAQGNGRTRVAWRKVRWSSVLHNTSVNLHWADNTGFAVEQLIERDLHAEAEAFLTDNPRSPTDAVAKHLKKRPQTVAELLRDSLVFIAEKGPKNANLWSVAGDSNLFVPDAGKNTDEQAETGEASSSSRRPSPEGRADRDGLAAPVRPDPGDTDPGDTDPDDRERWFDE